MHTRKPVKADTSDVPMDALLAFRIAVLAQLLNRGIEVALMHQLGLSVRQWRVLLYLATYGDAPLQVIADHTHLNKSQASRAVSELAARKLVRPASNPNDLRQVIVMLTPEGAAVQADGQMLSQARQQKLMSRLSSDEFQCLDKILNVLTDEARHFHAQAHEDERASK
ncbi:MAG: marR family transcriptional regulator [Herminiimonas sp.]|nr:marR family transcriptional regulator [Herminiimonas sp.]